MTATAHAVIGTVIAAKIGNPALAIPLALASHVALDMIPHWDTAYHSGEKDRKKVFIETLGDVVLGFSLSYSIIVFLFPQTNITYAFLMVVVAQLPDWLFSPYYFFNIKQFRWAYEFGKKTNTDLDKPWGVITQIVASVAVIFLGKVF